ncbi:MAG: hypothetical protein HY007_00720 [Candidatus Sungbacteria bacterium]|nr:hypothetical protein [Candidatus Sungbacteria bacterium]
MEQILEKLFDSVPKARILRIFMQNPDQSFIFDAIVKKSNVTRIQARKEINKLLKLGIIFEKMASIKNDIPGHKENEMPVKMMRAKVYAANQNFEVFQELRNLIIKSSIASKKNLLQRLKKLGRIRLAMIAGTLINNDRGRTDLLLVADDITKGRMEKFLSGLESEVGKQVHYTLMTKDEFTYRTNMYDRFLRDILEAPHEKLINRLNI